MHGTYCAVEQMGAMMRIGMNTLQKMGPAFKPVTEYRREYIERHTFIYLLVLGVANGMKGKGLGRKLIDAAIEKSKREGLQLLVGAGSEDNVKMYEHFGFKLLKRLDLPVVNLPEWEMVREPQD
jgi:predicted N-acetyltransferase YhbS